MALELDFVISDSKLNRYKFRILTSGIKTDNFKLNPVCPVEHNGHYFSVGKWKNLRVDGDVFKGTLEFDEEDETAVKLYKKYKNGYMSAVSLSVSEEEISESPEMLVPGQMYPTVTVCDLLEISVVLVPGKANAIKLFNKDGKEITLSLIKSQLQTPLKMDKTPEEVQKELNDFRKKQAQKLVKMHFDRGAIDQTTMGFYEKNAIEDFDATEMALQALPGKTIETGDTKEQLAKQLIELHFKRGVLTEPEREFFTSSAKLDYEGTKKVLEMRKGVEGVADVVDSLNTNNGAPGSADDRTKWSYVDWYKKDLSALQEMETKEPEKYSKLLASQQLSMKKEGIYSV